MDPWGQRARLVKTGKRGRAETLEQLDLKVRRGNLAQLELLAPKVKRVKSGKKGRPDWDLV